MSRRSQLRPPVVGLLSTVAFIVGDGRELDAGINCSKFAGHEPDVTGEHPLAFATVPA